MIDIEQRRKVQDLIQKGKYDSAQKALNHMMKQDPEEPSVHNTLGDVLIKLDKKEEALEHFSRAGMLYSLSGLHSAALSVARKALRIDENFEKAHYIKAVSLDKQGKNKEAVKEYMLFLKARPSVKEPATLHSCHAMTRLEPDKDAWVVRFAKVAVSAEDDITLKIAVDLAEERGLKQVGQLKGMLTKLKRKLGTDSVSESNTLDDFKDDSASNITIVDKPVRPRREPEKAPVESKKEEAAAEEEIKPVARKPKKAPVKAKAKPEPTPSVDETLEELDALARTMSTDKALDELDSLLEESEALEAETESEPKLPRDTIVIDESVDEDQFDLDSTAPPEVAPEKLPEPPTAEPKKKKKKKQPAEEPKQPPVTEEPSDFPSSGYLEDVEFEESDFMAPEPLIDDAALSSRKRIGEYFVAEGLLEAADVLRALEIQKSTESNRKLGDILVGLDLISTRELQEALSLQVDDMRNNLDRSRGDGLGYVELGNLLLEVGDFYGAIDAYLRACTIYRANEREYMVFELLEGVLDICPESLSAAKEIVRIRKAMDTEGQARAFYRLAVAYLLNDSPHEALAALERAVEVDSGFEMARTLMDGIRPGLADSDDYADIAMILADIDSMFDRNAATALAGIIREFKDGIDSAISTDDFSTHYDLGIAYMEMGLFRESLAEFEQVLRSPQYRMKAREMLGRCCLKLERFDEAEDHFRKGLTTTSGDLKASVGFHLAIADVYRATGRNSQAERELETAAKLDPDMVKVRRSLD